jgi:plasmid maintenance system antidote protein VapI
MQRSALRQVDPQARDAMLAEACAAIPITAFFDYREYLGAVYQWLKSRVDAYSYLRFAEDLGFSRTNVLHLVIHGKRKLGVKTSQRLVKSLGLQATERQFFLTLVEYCNLREPALRELFFQRLLQLRAQGDAADSATRGPGASIAAHPPDPLDGHGIRDTLTLSLSPELRLRLETEIAGFRERLAVLAAVPHAAGELFRVRIELEPASTRGSD